MPKNSDDDGNRESIEDAQELLQKLSAELQELYSYRDLFFEKHPVEMASEKNKLIEEKKQLLLENFEGIDVDTQVPVQLRAQFYYLKGKCYNISPSYDSSAIQCLSKAVKLNPHMVSAWNELGECYWKNMNVKEAKASFEGALKHERNRLSLRCLSIIVRQERFGRKNETTEAVFKSVELAKEAVALDTKDGVSWTVLGNAYLCKFFIISQDPSTLKLCMSAYRQAKLDPIAKGQPDLYYNEGVALKYEECYSEALESFLKASRLDPGWEPPQQALTELVQYLHDSQQLQRTRGKLKGKKLTQMIQSIDEKMLGEYGPNTFHTFGIRRNVQLKLTRLDALREGANEGTVILGRVVGSIHNDNSVPFTFAIVDSSMSCVCVTVYNWAGGRGAIIGDAVCIPEPVIKKHKHSSDVAMYEFRSIRVNNPTLLLVNGRRVGRNQFASTLVTSTYEAQ